MENPTFFMEAVVRGRADMEDFEGPLTLLLHLLSKNKVEIADIRIGVLCDQYLAYLEQMKEMDLEVASEFVQMASHLVYIKTRALLSGEEEIPELDMLISSMEQLQRREQYGQIKGVLEILAERYARGGGYTEKPPEYLEPERGYPYRHSTLTLLEALGRIFERGFEQTDTEERRFVMPTRIVYSVTDKADEILARLRREGETAVRTLFREARSRSEVVATFIAVLELCKMGGIRLLGEGADMAVEYTGVQGEKLVFDGETGAEDGAV